LDEAASSVGGPGAKVPPAPIIQAFTLYWRDMLMVVCMALMNVTAVVAAIFGAAYRSSQHTE
jgi:hypothetical protein